MNRAEKLDKIAELEERLSQAKGLYLADFTGMNVAMASELRRKCHEADVHFEVVKNTLVGIAAERVGLGHLRTHLAGPTALATSVADEIAPARVLVDFARAAAAELPKIKMAVIDGRVLSEENVKAIAALPGREQLLGQLLRALQAAASNFVSVLQAPLRDLAGVLGQLSRGESRTGPTGEGVEEPGLEGGDAAADAK